MKPRHYLLSLAAFGLLAMIPVAWIITGWNVITVMVEWFGPLLLGGAFTLVVAACLDYVLEGRRLTWLFSLAAGFGIFALGVLGGAAINFFLNARLSGDYGLYNEFFDWFVKPVYWLYVFGLPCSLVVGLLSHVVARQLQKRKAPAGTKRSVST